MAASGVKPPHDEQRSAIVIGAGIVGVCSACYLQMRGFRVTVIDRKPPGEETSWGNLGLIQHLPPSAFPFGAANRAAIMLNMRNDARVRPSALLQHLSAIMQYWWCSRPATYAQSVADYVTLVRHCTDEHAVLMRAAGAERLVRKAGFYEATAERSVEDMAPTVKRLRDAGVNVRALTGPELEAAEPAVTPGYFRAALYFQDTWCVTDPGALVKAYAASFTAKGGTIVEAEVTRVTPSRPVADGEGGGWAVETDSGTFEARHVVVAAGPWSAELLRPLGYNVPLYPLRGYNTHLAQVGGRPPLTTSIIEVDNGVGLTPTPYGVRVTTGSELANMDAAPKLGQLEAALTVARQLLPLGEATTRTWYGSRPCLPDMKPIIGPAPRHSGLYMNFGHGGNGLTLSAVSGRLLSELVSGATPFVNPAPFSASRFV